MPSTNATDCKLAGSKVRIINYTRYDSKMLLTWARATEMLEAPNCLPERVAARLHLELGVLSTPPGRMQ